MGDTPAQAVEERQEDIERSLEDDAYVPSSDAPQALLIAALAAAQGEFPPIEKTKTGTVRGTTKDNRPFEYSYSYADLADVLAKVRPVLSSNGLALVQRTVRSEGKVVVLVTELHHRAGGMIDSEIELGRDASDPQQFGGTLTYLRRYEAATLLGIAPEEDRDAQDVERPAQVNDLPVWATPLNQMRSKELLDSLEVLIGREAGRKLLIDVKNTAGALPSIVLPTVRAITEQVVSGDLAEFAERINAAREKAAANAPVVDPAESDVPPDTEGLPERGSLEPGPDGGLFDGAEGGE